jgi:hypothetical protein
MARKAQKKTKTSRSKKTSRLKVKAKQPAAAKKKAVKKKKAAAKGAPSARRRTIRVPPAHGSGAAIVLAALTGTERVARAKALLAEGKVYPQGCSGFVCDVLQITYRQANDIMAGSDVPANSIGKQPNYTNVSPGDVCGWLKVDDANSPQDDHVTIWIGEPRMQFIDVKRPGEILRKLGNGYELNQTLWKSRNV